MSAKSDRPGSHAVLPADAQRCVWMTAGLVAWKLCERGFECDGCPLDTALSGRPLRPLRVPARPGGALPFPDDRRYHAGHTWARRGEDGTVRVGLDAFAARVLAHANSAILPPAGSPIAAARAGCWMLDEIGPVALRMPVAGTVRRQNPLVAASPSAALHDPYESGWLVELDCPQADAQLSQLSLSRDAAPLAAAALQALNAEALRATTVAAVGPTAYDGGVPVTSPREALGPRRYHTLLQRLFA